jgi:hypothetical protein
VDHKWDGTRVEETPPLCSADSPTLAEASRTKEIQALLKFGRDSSWPLKITAAVEIDDQTSLSITYGSDWTDCNGTVEWFWSKFMAAAKHDQILVPKFFWNEASQWGFVPRKENNSLREVISETREGEPPCDREVLGLPAEPE